MVAEISWKAVLEKVFAEYGAQLRRAKVKKFAATIAKQQGRPEATRELKSLLKKFLSSDSGKQVIHNDDGMLSLVKGRPPPQPAPLKFSLLDLAEAADRMSQQQLSVANSAKLGKQFPKHITTGPRSARKRKIMDTTGTDVDAAPAQGAAMLTRTQLRQQGSNLHEAAVAADAAATPIFSPSAATRTEHSSKPAATAMPQTSLQQHTATLLPNGDVLRHLPVSQRGKDRAASGSRNANRHRKLEAAEAASTPSESHLGHDIDIKHKAAQKPKHSKQIGVDGAAQEPANTAAANAKSSVDVPETQTVPAQPAEQLAEPAEASADTAAKKVKAKRKRTESSHVDLQASAQPVIADASKSDAADPVQQADMHVVADAPPVAEPAQPVKKHKKRKHSSTSKQATAVAIAAAPALADAQVDNEAVVELTPAPESSTAPQEHSLPESAEQSVPKAKKRKHKSKDQGDVVGLPADSQQADPAVQPGASAMPAAQAVALTNEEEKAAAKLRRKKKRDKKRAKAAAAASAVEGHTAAAPVAVPIQPAEPVPAEQSPESAVPAVTEQPEHALMEQPAKPASADQHVKASKKTKKRRRTEKAQSQPTATDQTKSVVEPAGAPAAEPEAPSETYEVPESLDEPSAVTETHEEPSAVGQDTQDSAPAVTKPSSAKHGRKPKAVSGTSGAPADSAAPGSEQPAGKAKRGRKPKAASTPASDGTQAGDTAVTTTRARPKTSPAVSTGLVPTSWRAVPTRPETTVCSSQLSIGHDYQARTDVKKGKFSKQEKDTLKQAAQEYAQEHSLPADDFSWLFNTRTSEHKKDAAGAWQIIAQSLPHRTYKSVYACGTRMLHELNYQAQCVRLQGKWSKEEDEKLRELVTDRGPIWKEIGIVLGRLPEGCRDRWRDIKLGSSKHAGRWSEVESEKLRSLVSEYLALKQSNDGKPQADGALSLTLDDLVVGPKDTHGQQADGRIILDDIDWDVISSRHGSRSAPQCLTKWYTQLAPSMVSKGDWGSGDDRRLLKALLRSEATHEFQVDWGNLIARNATQTRRRWRLMLKCLQNATDNEFHENLRTLVKTFTPDLLPPDNTSAAKAVPADMAQTAE